MKRRYVPLLLCGAVLVVAVLVYGFEIGDQSSCPNGNYVMTNNSVWVCASITIPSLNGSVNSSRYWGTYDSQAFSYDFTGKSINLYTLDASAGVTAPGFTEGGGTGLFYNDLFTNEWEFITVNPTDTVHFLGKIEATNFNGNCTGNNTGDQDLSGYFPTANISKYVPYYSIPTQNVRVGELSFNNLQRIYIPTDTLGLHMSAGGEISISSGESNAGNLTLSSGGGSVNINSPVQIGAPYSLSSNRICLNGDCRTSWGSGSGSEYFFTSPWLYNVSNVVYFNETQLNTTINSILKGNIWYFVNDHLQSGTATGTLNATWQYDNYDGIGYNLSESVPNGLVWYGNTSLNATSSINKICIRYKSVSDEYLLSLFDDEGVWESYATLPISASYDRVCKDITDANEHIIEGKIMLRITNVGSAAPSHKISIDSLYLTSGISASSGSPAKSSAPFCTYGEARLGDCHIVNVYAPLTGQLSMVYAPANGRAAVTRNFGIINFNRTATGGNALVNLSNGVYARLVAQFSSGFNATVNVNLGGVPVFDENHSFMVNMSVPQYEQIWVLATMWDFDPTDINTNIDYFWYQGAYNTSGNFTIFTAKWNETLIATGGTATTGTLNFGRYQANFNPGLVTNIYQNISGVVTPWRITTGSPVGSSVGTHTVQGAIMAGDSYLSDSNIFDNTTVWWGAAVRAIQ